MAKSNPQADADLLAAKAGDKNALGRLLCGHHEGMIRNICVQYHGCGIDHDELFQEACLAGMEAVKYFDPKRGWKFTTYLGACVGRRLKTLRERKQFAWLPQAETDNQEAIYHQTPEVVLSDAFECLKSLPSIVQWVVQLRVIDELEFPQVARRLGLSLEATEKAYDEAMSFLRERVSTAGNLEVHEELTSNAQRIEAPETQRGTIAKNEGD